MSQVIPIVTKEDVVITHKERSAVLPTDITRASSLWITNSAGQILLAKRSRFKNHSPNCWGPGAAGTLEQDETYEENIIKEAKEELGIIIVNPKQETKHLVTKGHNAHFIQWYSCTVDKTVDQFTLQAEEVSEVRWFTKEELKKLFKEKPEAFIPNTVEWIHLFI